MPATMKALRKTQAGRGLQIENVAVPSVGPADVLVRVKATSICGTDLHIYGWDRWSQGRIKPPVTLGHEFCGVVERVGEEVSAVHAGDFVSAEMHLNCGHCHQCRLGQAHICQNLRIIGIDLDGAFAEFVKIPGHQYLETRSGDSRTLRSHPRPARQRGSHRAGGSDLRPDRARHRLRAHRPDVHRGGQSLRKFARCLRRKQMSTGASWPKRWARTSC